MSLKKKKKNIAEMRSSQKKKKAQAPKGEKKAKRGDTGPLLSTVRGKKKAKWRGGGVVL